MSSNSQLLNIINDIEKLNEQTTSINSDIITINGDITDLGTNKQNKIQVTDTIQISKLKTQYITMSLKGQDLQTALTSLGNDISSNADDIDGLQLLTSTHTSDINGKQDKLKAGNKITIDETTNTISSTNEKGDTGETGATGPQGIQGETGPQGIQGEQGPAGADGSGGTALDENSDIVTGTISSSDITGRFGTTIQAPNIHATGNLLINKNTTNNETINVLTDKQDTIYATTDIGPRQIIFSTIVGRNNATITSDNIRAKNSLSFLKNNQYLDVSSQLDNKQDTLKAGNGMTINETSNIISATGVTQDELTNGLNTKQNSINIYDNFIINSLYVAPFTSKSLVNPAVNGELRASIITAENTTIGPVNIGESIVSLITGLENKQDEIKTTSNLTLGTLDASGLITCADLEVGGKTITTLVDEASGSGLTQSDIDGKQNKLYAGANVSIDQDTNTISSTFTINENTDITTGSIISDDITSRVGHNITGGTIRARTNLLIGTGVVNTINVVDELNKNKLNYKLEKILQLMKIILYQQLVV